MSWPSGSRIMMARPPMSVSSRMSPPAGRTLARAAAMSATATERWVNPRSFITRRGAGWTPAPAKWISSSTKRPLTR